MAIELTCKRCGNDIDYGPKYHTQCSIECENSDKWYCHHCRKVISKSGRTEESDLCPGAPCCPDCGFYTSEEFQFWWKCPGCEDEVPYDPHGEWEGHNCGNFMEVCPDCGLWVFDWSPKNKLRRLVEDEHYCDCKFEVKEVRT